MPRVRFLDGPRAHEPGGVYSLRAPGDNAIRYVGLAYCLRTRWQMHMCAARRAERLGKTTALNRWVLGLLANGQRPVLERLEVVHLFGDRHAGERREREWIRRLEKRGEPLLNVAHMRCAIEGRKLRSRSAGAS